MNLAIWAQLFAPKWELQLHVILYYARYPYASSLHSFTYKAGAIISCHFFHRNDCVQN